MQQRPIEVLLKEDYPIVVSTASVVMPEEDDDDDPETKDFLKNNNIAAVSFKTKYYDNPSDEYPCDPGVYIVYVDIDTGEVHIPRHM